MTEAPVEWKYGKHNFSKRLYVHANYQERTYNRHGFKYYRRQAVSYSLYSHGLYVAYVKFSERKLDKGVFENFSKERLPHVISVNMMRLKFSKLKDWLRWDFTRWSMEAVPESGVESREKDTPIEYLIGFETPKECAIFLLYMDAVLSGDVPISYPPKPKRVRKTLNKGCASSSKSSRAKAIS